MSNIIYTTVENPSMKAIKIIKYWYTILKRA
jgi:hypothetical protein